MLPLFPGLTLPFRGILLAQAGCIRHSSRLGGDIGGRIVAKGYLKRADRTTVRHSQYEVKGRWLLSLSEAIGVGLVESL